MDSNHEWSLKAQQSLSVCLSNLNSLSIHVLILTENSVHIASHLQAFLTSCIMISFCGNWVSRPLACTASRFCHKLSEWALFLSCSCKAGGEETPDPPLSSTVPARTPEERFSRCRRCSISCCLEVSRYSWYKKPGGSKENKSDCRYRFL